MRVAAGAIAKKWLKERFGVTVRGYMSKLGEIDIPFESWDGVNDNPFFSPNQSVLPKLEEYLDKIRAERDSVGARITVVAEGVPVGWGEPVFDRLDADIARQAHSRRVALPVCNARSAHGLPVFPLTSQLRAVLEFLQQARIRSTSR